MGLALILAVATTLVPFASRAGSAGSEADAVAAQLDAEGSWVEIANTGAPSPRGIPLGIRIDRGVLIFGGNVSSQPNPVIAGRDGAIYAPDLDAWTPISLAPHDFRSYDHSVWTGREVLVWSYDHGASYDPSNDTWSVIHNDLGLLSCGGQAVVWTGSEMIVWGGDATIRGCS